MEFFVPDQTDTIVHPGRVIEKMRLERGWSQNELAERSGLSKQLISALKTEGSKPRAKTVRALALALGCDPLEIDPNYSHSPASREKKMYPASWIRPGSDADALITRVSHWMENELGFSPSPFQVVQYLVKKSGLDSVIKEDESAR
jgi:transcriptional regulator with XRE-family HTH domain